MEFFCTIFIFDQLASASSRSQNLNGGNTAAPVCPWHKALGDDGFQNTAQLQPDLLLLVGSKR